MGDSTIKVSVDRLQVGMYIHLDLSWLEHPFSFNQFRIKSPEQIATIRSLGLTTVRYDPARSDARPLDPQELASQTQTPLPMEADAAPNSQARADSGVVEPVAVIEKQQRLARLREHRAAVQRAEQAFMAAAQTMRDMKRLATTQPKACVEQVRGLAQSMSRGFLEDPQVAMHVMSERVGGEEAYYHSLNVTLLALMLARSLKLDAEQTAHLAIGALFHDVGLFEIPDRILRKPDPLTRSEREFRELHCEYGVKLMKDAGLSTEALLIISQHHEAIDGTGYPNKLKAQAIHPLARIVALVNHYDNLCNPARMAESLTPFEALSTIYAQQRSRFDADLLQRLIRSLGVYPPGSIVQLSNEALAAVVASNPDKPLRPTVVVYDADVPKEDAITINLEYETDVNIARAIKPAQLSRPVYDYLSPRKRISYFFDSGPGGGEGNG